MGIRTISEFFDKKTKRNCPSLMSGVCKSDYLIDFYNDCVEKTLPDVKIVMDWHQLLKNYIEDQEAVFFVRRYGSTKDKDGKWDIRRGFLTVFNNVKIVYVDNFFAQYFYTMAINNFVPEYDDFKKFILNREIPYGSSVVSLEHGHQAYLKGASSPLNRNGWKHSHVFSANQNDYIFDYKKIASKLFPKGEYKDFIKQGGSSYPYRKIEQDVSEEDLKRIKAHFLRVVHPINYFLTPKVKLQSSTEGIKDIGEYPEMIAFMKEKLNEMYGEMFYEYQNMIMAPSSTSSPKNPYIGLSYGMELGKSCSITTGHKVVKTASKSDSSIVSVTPSIVRHKIISVKSSFTPEQIANCIRAYLFDGMSFRIIEQTYLGMPKRANGGGFMAKEIINSKGIDSSMKNKFYGKTITEAIGLATDPLKSTLIWMETNLKP